MTSDRIAELAREAGMVIHEDRLYQWWIRADMNAQQFCERFAALIAAEERAACARVCRDLAEQCSASDGEPDEVETQVYALSFAADRIERRAEG